MTERLSKFARNMGKLSIGNKNIVTNPIFFAVECISAYIYICTNNKINYKDTCVRDYIVDEKNILITNFLHMFFFLICFVLFSTLKIFTLQSRNCETTM